MANRQGILLALSKIEEATILIMDKGDEFYLNFDEAYLGQPQLVEINGNIWLTQINLYIEENIDTVGTLCNSDLQYNQKGKACHLQKWANF